MSVIVCGIPAVLRMLPDVGPAQPHHVPELPLGQRLAHGRFIEIAPVVHPEPRGLEHERDMHGAGGPAQAVDVVPRPCPEQVAVVAAIDAQACLRVPPAGVVMEPRREREVERLVPGAEVRLDGAALVPRDLAVRVQVRVQVAQGAAPPIASALPPGRAMTANDSNLLTTATPSRHLDRVPRSSTETAPWR